MEAKERIIVALDVDTVEKAKPLVEELSDYVGVFKIGLEFINSMLKEVISGFWWEAVHNLSEIRQLFKLLSGRILWDGKFNDIPNTVAGAAQVITKLNVKMFNIHCLSGIDALIAARKTAEEVKENNRPLILGVTILTSLNYQNLVSMGIVRNIVYSDKEGQKKAEQNQIQYLVKNLALLAQEAGLDGVICSPQEIKMLRECCRPKFLIVTPGIRPEWAAVGDQKRIMTPKEAIALGADYLVIGRPITSPPPEIGSPIEAAKRITQEIEEGLKERGY